MVNVKISKDPQTSKNIRGVFRRKGKIPMSPIEELTTPVQMGKLEPWIKQIYGQAKLTSGTFSGPLKADSQYNDKEEHQPISDWSARVNKEYYDNMIDTSLEWGKFNEPGSYGGLANKSHPIWYPYKQIKKPYYGPIPKPDPGPPGPVPIPKPPKPAPIPPYEAGKDWYNLKWNKIKQGTLQGEAVSYLSFWVGSGGQIRKGYENDIIVAFANPYVGLNTRYSKGILIDGLIFNTDTFNEITARLLDPGELLKKVDAMVGQRIKFVGDLSNDVCLHDTTHGDHEPTLAYKHIPLKDAGTERSKKDTNRVYWLVESFKVLQIEGYTGSLFTQDDTTVGKVEKLFLALVEQVLKVIITEKRFLEMTPDERRELYDRMAPYIGL